MASKFLAYEIHEILLNEIRKTPVVFFVGSYLFILGANTAHVTIDPNQTDNPTTCMNFKITSIKKRLPPINFFMIFIPMNTKHEYKKRFLHWNNSCT